MWKKHHVREILLLTAFLIIAFIIGISSSFLNKSETRTTSAFAAEADDSCREGVYYVKNPDNPGEEISCGRGKCGGVSYEGTASIDHVKAGKCWVGNSACGPACKGFVPLCCYKMAETGDAKDCPFPERGFCMKQQCNRQTQNVDSACGNQQGAYCLIPNCVEDRGQIPFFSLEDRLAGRKTPSGGGSPPTATQVPPTAVPTATKTPNMPTSTKTPTPTQVPAGQNTPTPTTRVIGTSPTPTTIVGNPPTPTSTSNSGSGLSMNPTTPPGQINPTATPSQDTAALPEIDFNIPQIALKSPGQMLQETVNEEQINNLNTLTNPPLAVAEKTFVTIKSYDQQLENTVEGWIDYVRIQITKLFQ